MSIKQEQIEKLLNAAQDLKNSITQEDFLKSFEGVVKQILQVEKKLVEKIDTKTQESVKKLDEITATHKATVQRIEEDNKTGMSNLKKFAIGKITELFVKSGIDKKIRQIDEKLADVRDGEDADEERMIEKLKAMIPTIPDFEMPQSFLDEIIELKTENEKQQEEIEELKKRPVGRGGGTSAIGVAQAFKYIAHTEAPVGVIDGANLTYTVSKDIWWIAGFTLNGESIAELPNFTFVGRTITFSTALPAAYSGKDFEIKYIG